MLLKIIFRANCIKLKSMIRENVKSVKNIKNNLYSVKKDCGSIQIDLKKLKEEFINNFNKRAKIRSITTIKIKTNKTSSKNNAAHIKKGIVDACTSTDDLIVKKYVDACTSTDDLIVKKYVDGCTSTDDLIAKKYVDACTSSDDLIVKNHIDSCTSTDDLIIKKYVDACTSTDDLIVKNHVDSCTSTDDLIVKNHVDSCTSIDDICTTKNKPSTNKPST